jgi:acetyl esterase/lipase
MSEDVSILTRGAPRPHSTLAYGTETDQLVDIRPGAAGAARRPLVVLIHGGYWRPAYDRAHMAPMAAAIAGLGWTVANIEYRRVPGDSSVTFADVSRAVELLPSRAPQHDGRMIIAGFSAGGYLALWLAQSNAHAGLHSVLALAPVADLRLAEARQLGDGAVRAFLGARFESLSDIDPRRMPDSPVPVTIVHGSSDDVVPIELSESYLAAHPATRFRRLPMIGHFALVDPATYAWPIVLEELQRLSDA